VFYPFANPLGCLFGAGAPSLYRTGQKKQPLRTCRSKKNYFSNGSAHLHGSGSCRFLLGSAWDHLEITW